MLFNPIETLCEWKQLGGNWMSHSICCPHATAMLIYSKCTSLPTSFLQLTHDCALNLPQSWRGLLSSTEWCFSLNSAGTLSPACRASLSIMISTMPVRCYLVMFEDRLCCWTSGNVVWNARRFNTSFHWSFSHAHSSFISQKYLALHLITFDCWSNGDRDQFLSVWTWGSYSCIPITTQLL